MYIHAGWARPKLVGTSRKSIQTRCSGNGIYAPYFERYVNTVCGNMSERVRELCVRDMRVPPLEEQQQIINELEKLKTIVHIDESAEGAMLLLLRDGQDITIEILVAALTDYYEALNIVREIVNDTFNQVI